MRMRIKEEKNNILISDGTQTVLYNASTRKMFVSDKNIEETLYEIESTEVDEKKNIHIDNSMDEIETIVVNCTECCNLKCKYCYVHEGTYNSDYSMMNDEVYLQLIKNYFILNKNGVKVIHFFGGEPLIGFKQIEKFCEELTGLCLGQGVTPPVYTMTTNGTLITREMADFFEKYKFKICISLDGPKEINDKERISDSIESVYDVVREKMELFRNREVTVACEATLAMAQLSQMSREDLWNYFDFFNTLPISFVAIFIAKETMSVEDGVFELNVQRFYEAYIDYVLESILNNKKIICYSNIVAMIQNVMMGGNYHVCGAGHRQIFLNAAGDVYPCQMFYSARSEKMGNIYNVKELMRVVDKRKHTPRVYKKCKECNFASFCSICPGVNVITNNDAMVLDRESCLETKILVSTLLWKITKLAADQEKYMQFAVNLQEYIETCNSIMGDENE